MVPLIQSSLYLNKKVGFHLKIVLYDKANCPKCRFTEQRLKAPYTTIRVDPMNDEATMNSFREQGFQSFPVVYVYQDNKIIDKWCDLNLKKINQYNQNVGA